MLGVFTDVEKAMIEVERHAIVRKTRSAFRNAMRDPFVGEIERLSGRRVTLFLSNSHVGARPRDRVLRPRR
jgi:uncharacterized protein (DUF2252 family)